MIGPGMDEMDQDRLRAGWEAIQQQEMLPLDGESEKTAEELQMIDSITSYLDEELRGLDLPGYDIDPRRIHFVNKSALREYVLPGDDGALAFCNKFGTIFLDKEVRATFGKEEFFDALLHEMIHSASMKKFYIDAERSERSGIGTGYVTSRFAGGEMHEHFRGLNEGITEVLTMQIIQKNSAAIEKKFGINQKDFDEVPSGYVEYLDLCMEIMEKIAKKQERPPKEVWRDFRRGMFSGEMMHLRAVEETFGAGALRMLAAIESRVEADVSDGRAIRLIAEFFATDNEADRDAIAKEVLVEREYEAYQKERTMPERMEKYREVGGV